ncbi:hypothetical protein D5018_16495 [Parashewanella curva]|uniref:Uncharacterized protein n=1 Tax=Parashewanella curva TaxID=2338552 RepID=A0A3L8PTH6_9GAMM|nr:hypothetical protein [Parashewanella curva]RLV58594.1 hypothetical protein D5018_16495 [Parashewanella curva]
MPKSFQYLQQDCQLTLRQGVEEYTAGYSHLNKNDGASEESRWFFCHDCTHVLFGTIPFEIKGESINDVWTLFGTDMTLKNYFKFFQFVDYGVVLNSYVKTYGSKWRVYLALIGLIPTCIKPMIRGWRMNKEWDWFNPEPYLDKPLAEIRKEFGVKVIASK